ncbi:hypothetical protein KY329_05350 [Candidatus Woesearchaeota archaeon]|nr:hypothetical protein [Candidatus Woesearchaeota archaeon]
MARINVSVFDAGPFIHLHEIRKLNLTNLFKTILTTPDVFTECQRIQAELKKIKNLSLKALLPKSKDFAKYLVERYDLDLGESTGLALCRQEHVKLFFTDDLEARNIAQRLGFEAHGTIAILLRAYRNNILNKKEAKQVIEDLYNESSLFFTRDLRNWTINEIEKFRK